MRKRGNRRNRAVRPAAEGRLEQIRDRVGEFALEEEETAAGRGAAGIEGIACARVVEQLPGLRKIVRLERQHRVQNRVIAVDHEGTGLFMEPRRDQDAGERRRRGGALVELEVDGQPIQKVCLAEQARRLAAACRFAGAFVRGRPIPSCGVRSRRVESSQVCLRKNRD